MSTISLLCVCWPKPSIMINEERKTSGPGPLDSSANGFQLIALFRLTFIKDFAGSSACQGFGGGRDEKTTCLDVLSNEQCRSDSLSLSSSFSFSFKNEKLGMDILTLARGINHLLCSVQQLSESRGKYRPKRIEELFLVFFFLLCTCVCGCECEMTRN